MPGWCLLSRIEHVEPSLDQVSRSGVLFSRRRSSRTTARKHDGPQGATLIQPRPSILIAGTRPSSDGSGMAGAMLPKSSTRRQIQCHCHRHCMPLSCRIITHHVPSPTLRISHPILPSHSFHSCQLPFFTFCSSSVNFAFLDALLV